MDEASAWKVVRIWLRKQLPWPFRWGKRQESLLFYAPFWLVAGRSVGVFANGKRGLVDRPVSWAQPAYDVSELMTVRDIWLAGDELVPLDRDALMRDGMVLKASVPQAEGWQKAVDRLLQVARTTDRRSRQSRVELIERRQALLFYPLWLIRFRYWGRYYRAIVDGTEPRLLAGQVSDRMPKLILLVATLGMLGSLFGIWGFVVASVLGAILAPRVAGVEEPQQRQTAQLPRARDVESLWLDTSWRERKQGKARGAWVAPLRCPTCDRPLSAERGAVLFYCQACRQGIEHRAGALRPVAVEFAQTQSGGHVPHPWWVLTVRVWRKGDSDALAMDATPLEIYVPAYSLPLADCIAQGVHLTRLRPRFRKTKKGRWRTCTISREDAMRLAELIYLSLDESTERFARKLELTSLRLIVFLSE
jgi:hypothetical protein